MSSPARRQDAGEHGLATRSAEDLYRLLVESVRDYAIFVLDPAGRIASWNRGAQRIKGYTAEDVMGRHYSMFYPPQIARSGDPDRQLVVAEEEGRFEGEGWRVRKDGTRFWAHVVITALWENGELVGFGKVTGDLTAEREAQEALRQRERQLSEAQQIAHLGSWEWNIGEDVITWSDELYRIYGIEVGSPIDLHRYASLLHEQDRERAMGVIRGAMEAGEAFSFEHRINQPDGQIRHIQSRGEVVLDDEGRPERLIGTALDVTELHRAREKERLLEAERLLRQEAEQTALRMGFLAAATQVLGTSLDYEDTLRSIAGLAVPEFADWCAVDLVEPRGGMRRVGMETVNIRDAEETLRIHAAHPSHEELEEARQVIETGTARLLREIPAELLDRAARSEEHRRLLEEAGVHSAILAPITVRERVMGVITFAYAGSDRTYSEEDLVVARELAERAGLAMENSHLHAAEQHAREHAEQASERMSRLQAVTAGLSEAVTPEAVARVIVEQGMAALDAAHGSLALVRDDGSLVIADSVGLPREVTASYSSFDIESDIPLALAVRSGEPVVIEQGVERDRRFPMLTTAWTPSRTGAVVAIPVRSGDRVIGSLEFGYIGDRAFVLEDREFLASLGRQCAQALDRAWLYEGEQVAREAAEAASQAKSQFLAMMSHELRTPLSAIIGYQELLSEGIVGPITERQKEQLSRIRASATHLRDLINQILSLSRIEAGKEELLIEDVDLVALVEDSALLLEQEAQSKGVELVTRIPEEPVEVRTDPGKVRQILLNLLSNAIKFTDQGTVTLEMDVAPSNLMVAVEDTGTGIDENDRERIFEAFTQVDQSMTRRAGGSGLGLPVSRQLAELLGGELYLDWTNTFGSRFTLRLPRTVPETAPEPATHGS